MRDTYSLYEAKARFSAIIRQVREGRSVLVTVRGEPVAEIRALGPTDKGLRARLDAMAERGLLARGTRGTGTLSPIVRRPKALSRFLAERDR
jgi:antitoxin (DNA-binding transcriptional repressor) of toxin-antitoxin stability system